MSVWLELRCNEAGEDHADRVFLGHGNYSVCFGREAHDNGLMVSAKNKQNIMDGYKHLESAAVNQGWKKINGEWVCPHCLKYGHRSGVKADDVF